MSTPRQTQLAPSGLLPRLYAIVDAAGFAEEKDEARQAAGIAEFVQELLAGGATLLQYRNKPGNARRVLEGARALRSLTRGKARLILNDRADLCLAAECDGVHLGREDLSAEAARRILGDRLWVGVSTHSVEQVKDADRAPVDYIAVGPVFATASKERPDPVVGLEGVRAARRATSKPLVAIGGITRANCRSVVEAGADSVAVIADLRTEPRKAVEEFLRILR
jgi:thiamine-phosphate pyrophosphorylase